MTHVGTATLEGGHWHVVALPHVVMRLKRVFPRIDTRQHGTIRIRDSAEVCRELLWFSERFPLEISPLHYAEQQAASHRELEVAITDLMAGRTAPLMFDLALPLRDYQRVAADIALQTGGLLVADDLGLGKTATAIACLTDPRARPALVVTLTHLPQQWVREIRRFAPGLVTHIVKKGTPYPLPAADVLVINYHKLAGWADHLATVIRGIVFDEVQELRHDGSNKAAAARHLANHAWLRVGLSATPIFNYGGEMFSVVDVLRPGALGTRDEFLNEWCVSVYGDKPRVHDPRAFGTYLRDQGLMIRRTRADVRRELPPLTKIPHYVDADNKALDAVSRDVAELARVILAQGGDGWKKRQASGELDWRLRQATGVAKAPYVADFVRLLVESGERVVLYGWHREVYSIWQDRLSDLGIVFYTGAETASAKESAAATFCRGEAQVLAMSLRAGAGLDGLQGAARTVVFGELDWSPGVHEQATGRVYRDGQTEPVAAYYLLSDSGSDPVIADVIGVKRAQLEGLRDPATDLIQDLTVDEDRIRKLAESVLRQRVHHREGEAA